MAKPSMAPSKFAVSWLVLLFAGLFALLCWGIGLGLWGSAALARGQSYTIPVSVRVVMARGEVAANTAAPKLTESETYRFLWRVTSHPLGRVEVSHRGHRVPATLVTQPAMALILTRANFLTLAGLAMPIDEPADHQTQMVQVPMWSYPAGVEFVASQDNSGYLSFTIVTGGEPPAN